MLKNLSSILGMMVKAVADGDKSNPVTKLYWWLAGKKTWISIGMYALWAFGTYVLVPVFTQCGPECGGEETIAQIDAMVKYLPEVATVLLGFGLFDAAVRLEPPKQKE